jgi:hypothetical protein
LEEGGAESVERGVGGVEADCGCVGGEGGIEEAGGFESLGEGEGGLGAMGAEGEGALEEGEGLVGAVLFEQPGGEFGGEASGGERGIVRSGRVRRGVGRFEGGHGSRRRVLRRSLMEGGGAV